MENKMDEFEKEWRLLRRGGVKTSALRREYEQKVAALSKTAEKLAAPPLFREYIYAATAAKYGDPLGPTFDMLRQTKSCRQIIASASRPIADLDDRLTLEGFRAWYLRRVAESEHKAE